MTDSVPTFDFLGFKIPIKYASLVILVIQNSALFLTLRMSRTQEGPLYVPGTAVILSETFKFLTSLLLVYFSEGSVSATMHRLHEDIVKKPMTTLKLLVPSALYTLQGNLMFWAVTYIDAATFQVTYQLKILTTALFAVLLLGKQLSLMQWVSLIMLMAGVVLIQRPETADDSAEGEEAIDGDNSTGERMIGLIMVLIACFSSGFAGIYFEKVLKGETAGVWVLNVQLGLFGMINGTIGLMSSDGAKVMENGFFYGYTTMAFIAISLQAFGGLVVAVVVKYADNILKGFATSISIVISCIVSAVYLDFVVTGTFSMGTLLVIAATFIYGNFGVAKK